MFGVSGSGSGSVSVEHVANWHPEIWNFGIGATGWNQQPWWSVPGLDRGQNRLEARESFEVRTETDFQYIPRDQKVYVITVLSLDHDEIKR